MTTEYQDSIREGFEDHIAKQQGLEDIPKSVLAVQVFAMNENLDYIDEKLQKKWVEWRSSSIQQREKDEKMCSDLSKSIKLTGIIVSKDIMDAGVAAADSLEKAIHNQDKE